MGRNSVHPSIHPSVRLSVPPLAGPQTLLAGPQTLLAGPQTPPAGPQTPPASPQTPPAGPQTPPVGLQAPLAGPQGLWGRCPATLCNFTISKKQGKGTADLMSFGVLFLFGSPKEKG